MFLSSFLDEDASTRSRVVPLPIQMDDLGSKEAEEEEDGEEWNDNFQSHLQMSRKSSSFAYGNRKHQRREGTSSGNGGWSYDVESGGGMISTGPVSSTWSQARTLHPRRILKNYM